MRHALQCVLGAVITASLVAVAVTPAAADDAPEDTAFAEPQDEAYKVTLSHLSVRVDDTPMTTSSATLQNVLDAYEAADVICMLRQGTDEEGELLNEETELCEADDGPTVAEVVAIVSSEFRVLPIAAPEIAYQPEGDWALINIDFIVYTEAGSQLLDTTILGVPVTVRATPIHYSWNFGDGSPALGTTDQGRPYPNQTVAHVYTSAADAVEVTLTTTWQGELQINGSGPWLPIVGFATTTSSTPPVEIVAMDVHLVP